MAKKKYQPSTPARVASPRFTIHPQVGEVIDPDVTPILRPTLVLGREHEYQTQYELAELKRKLSAQNTLPMPPNCVALLEGVWSHLEGSLSADALQASLGPLTSEDLAATIDYCVQQKWLNEWSGVIQLTHGGVHALNKQLAFNAASGKSESWPGLSPVQKAILVATIARECGSRTVSGLAEAVAGRFQPAANAGSIRSWINRNGALRDAILRHEARKRTTGAKREL